MTTSELPDSVARTEADDGTRKLLLQAIAELTPSQGTIVPDLAHL